MYVIEDNRTKAVIIFYKSDNIYLSMNVLDSYMWHLPGCKTLSWTLMEILTVVWAHIQIQHAADSDYLDVSNCISYLKTNEKISNASGILKKNFRILISHTFSTNHIGGVLL